MARGSAEGTPRASAREGSAAPGESWGARRRRLLDRFAAWRSTRRRLTTSFVSQPEPRSIGSPAQGRQILAGNFMLAGFLVEGPELSPWDLPVPAPGFEAALHGFAWLDDLAAVGTPAARMRAQDWVFDWIGRFGGGLGPGWTADLAGRRLIRWINHAPLLLHGRDRAGAEIWFRSVAQQVLFLSRRWHAAPPGLPRFEALTGLIAAGLTLTGMEHRAAPAVAALARECDLRIAADGGIASRNPEELLEIFTLLSWTAAALEATGRAPGPAHAAALARIAPVLRRLRHADGGLARFHGGGRGREGRLDQALAAARPPRPDAASLPPDEDALPLAMGYARIHAGRTSIIVDAAQPAAGAASAGAHASTLAFELTSGRRPVIVSCGSGAAFGPDWHRAGRATPSHSTVAIEGYSSSRLGPDGGAGHGSPGMLTEVPGEVWHQQEGEGEGGARRLIFGHNGYVPTHGLSHIRELELTPDGRGFFGTDTLGAMSGDDRRRLEVVIARGGGRGIPFSLHFHLHPDVDAALDLGGAAVSLALKSGEIWIFRHDGVARMTLAPSVYMEARQMKPRAAQQIVLSAMVQDHACQIGWTLAKAQDTPTAIRDLAPGDSRGADREGDVPAEPLGAEPAAGVSRGRGMRPAPETAQKAGPEGFLP